MTYLTKLNLLFVLCTILLLFTTLTTSTILLNNNNINNNDDDKIIISSFAYSKRSRYTQIRITDPLHIFTEDDGNEYNISVQHHGFELRPKSYIEATSRITTTKMIIDQKPLLQHQMVHVNKTHFIFNHTWSNDIDRKEDGYQRDLIFHLETMAGNLNDITLTVTITAIKTSKAITTTTITPIKYEPLAPSLNVNFPIIETNADEKEKVAYYKTKLNMTLSLSKLAIDINKNDNIIIYDDLGGSIIQDHYYEGTPLCKFNKIEAPLKIVQNYQLPNRSDIIPSVAIVDFSHVESFNIKKDALLKIQCKGLLFSYQHEEQLEHNSRNIIVFIEAFDQIQQQQEQQFHDDPKPSTKYIATFYHRGDDHIPFPTNEKLVFAIVVALLAGLLLFVIISEIYSNKALCFKKAQFESNSNGYSELSA